MIQEHKSYQVAPRLVRVTRPRSHFAEFSMTSRTYYGPRWDLPMPRPVSKSVRRYEARGNVVTRVA